MIRTSHSLIVHSTAVSSEQWNHFGFTCPGDCVYTHMHMLQAKRDDISRNDKEGGCVAIRSPVSPLHAFRMKSGLPVDPADRTCLSGQLAQLCQRWSKRRKADIVSIRLRSHIKWTLQWSRPTNNSSGTILIPNFVILYFHWKRKSRSQSHV